MINSILHPKQINTDADFKGLVLQKIRVVERLLAALINGKKTVFCTIEHIDDVLEVEIDGEKANYTTEQDKSYSTPFSINSPEIKNSLRIFFDNWYKITEFSESINFVFYTNTSIAREKKVGVLKSLEKELPKEPLLQLLIEKRYDEAFPFVLPILKEYYIEQHSKHTKEIDAYTRLWETMSQEKWKIFFNLIEWNFNRPDEHMVRASVYECTKSLCTKYGIEHRFIDKIVAQLLDMVESRSFEKDYLCKIVHVGEVKATFLEFAQDAKVFEKLDPSHIQWDTIQFNDIRDINDKILNVCPTYDKQMLEDLEEEYIDGSFEQNKYSDIREVKAYNYRVYVTCKKIVKRIIREKQGDFQPQEIDIIIKNLTDEAEKIIIDKAKTYKMPFMDRDMVRKTILLLLQECYLAFDERSVINE